MTEEIRDLASRASWTAAQAFLAVFLVTDVSTVKSAAVAAAGAGLSVVKTYVNSKRGS
jgi:hypothetical protein